MGSLEFCRKTNRQTDKQADKTITVTLCSAYTEARVNNCTPQNKINYLLSVIIHAYMYVLSLMTCSVHGYGVWDKLLSYIPTLYIVLVSKYY